MIGRKIHLAEEAGPEESGVQSSDVHGGEHTLPLARSHSLVVAFEWRGSLIPVFYCITFRCLNQQTRRFPRPSESTFDTASQNGFLRTVPVTHVSRPTPHVAHGYHLTFLAA
jgi:hypothetical protein